jgi:acetate kinase
VNVLVANTGSSSLKLRLLDASEGVAAEADLPAPGDPLDLAPLERFLAEAPPPEAVGHRIVHGGAEFGAPALLDREGIARLGELGDLAPLHNGPALRVLDALRRLWPDVPHVACFDTAFHSGLPDAAALYALPGDWVERFGLRRYGFHGISHAWAARRTGELLGRPAGELRVVTCHLGAGASLAAVERGRSVDTTMGFTPNEGLVMATRSGSVDPGMLVWLLRDAGLSLEELAHGLEHESGVLGLSGATADMREVVAGERADERDRIALEVYVHRLRAGVAGMAAAMGGLDALAFTGGVGEHAPLVRARACAGLGFLGVGLDDGLNDAARGDADVSRPGDAAGVVVVESREDLEIARAVRSLLGAA